MSESVEELKASVEALEAALARAKLDGWVLRTLCEAMPERVFWKDCESTYLGSNTAFARDCGLSTHTEIPGTVDHDHFPQKQADFFVQCDREVMGSERALLGIDEPQDRPDGSTSYLRTNKAAILDSEASVVGILGTYIDVTEEKGTKERLEKALVRAKVSEAKNDFLTTVSHEIRTPLTLILGPLEVLVRRQDLPEHTKGQLQVMCRNARRLKCLIDDVLDLRRADADMMTPTPVNADIGTLLEHIVRDIQPAAQAAGLELGLKLDRPLRSRVDATMLDRILLNLLANALKFTPQGGSIEVRGFRQNNSLRIEVEDTGPGLDASDLNRLFDAYEQAGAPQGGGTGLGLALVRRFCELLGGQVEVRTQAGEGSCFSVIVPIVDWTGNEDETTVDKRRVAEVLAAADGLQAAPASPHSASESVDGEQSATPQIEGIRVLCVDDNQDMREHLRTVLGSVGVLELAENGKAALDKLPEFRPHVIVSDVMMPVMNGLELVSELKKRTEYRPIPVILLTARAGYDSVASGLNDGADDYVCKPFEPFELRARVRAAARAYGLYRELAESRQQLAEYKKGLEVATQSLIQFEPLAVLGQQVVETVGDLRGSSLEGLAGGAGEALRKVLEQARRLRKPA